MPHSIALRTVVAFIAVSSVSPSLADCFTPSKPVVEMSAEELHQYYVAPCEDESDSSPFNFPDAKIDGPFLKLNRNMVGASSSASDPTPAQKSRGTVLSKILISMSPFRAQVQELSTEGDYSGVRDSLQTMVTAIDKTVAEKNLPTPAQEAIFNEAKELSKIAAENRARAFWSHWSAGLILNFKDSPPVESAVVEAAASTILSQAPGIVRIKRGNEIKMGLGLEAHRFMGTITFGNDLAGGYSSSIAIGPYVSIMPGANDIVDVLGAGLLVGLLGDHRYDPKKDRFTMNLGIGYFWDFNSLHVKDDIEDGQPLPSQYSTVELEERTDKGLQFMVSFSLYFGE